MTDIAQYIFLEFIKMPQFFDNGFLIAIIFWLCGVWLIGFFIWVFFN